MAAHEPRILICRLTAIGDSILTLPMLCALRRNFPRSYIAWAAQPPTSELLAEHSCLDEVIEVPKGFLKSPRALLRLRKTLREGDFDVTLDPQSLFKSALAARLSGAPQRIGFAAPLGREFSTWLNNTRIARGAEHIVDHHRELLTPLGVRLGPVEFRVPLQEPASSKIAQWREAAGLGRFAVLNPGAGWPSKVWPCERFADTARELGERFQLPSVVTWAGRKEGRWAEQVVARSGGHAIQAPATSLLELAALLRQARLFLGSDTGPMHLAAAVGTPCAALFGPTSPADCGPYGSQHIVIQRSHTPYGLLGRRRRRSNRDMCAIQVRDAVEAVERLLRRTAERPQAA